MFFRKNYKNYFFRILCEKIGAHFKRGKKGAFFEFFKIFAKDAQNPEVYGGTNETRPKLNLADQNPFLVKN
jgi:hypothetical protein